MVAHLTSIRPERGVAPSRLADLATALGDIGFERAGAREPVFTSTIVEAGSAKAYLRGRGFADAEYRVFLEYVRLWGTL
jgi:hypothetical protein